MSETITRLISGVVYAALLLFAIFISEYTFIVLIFIFGIFTLHELQNLLKIKSDVSYLFLPAFLVFFNIFHFLGDEYVFRTLMIITVIVNGLLSMDLLISRKIIIFKKRKYMISIFYLFCFVLF